MPRLAPSLLLLTLLAGLASASARAADAAAPVALPAGGAPADAAPHTSLSLRERVLRMTDFLDTMLPGTLGRSNITVHFTPKFTDFRDREFVRYPLELRYGATDRLELISGISPFAPNPINSGRDHRWGPGEAKLGARYDLADPLFFYDAATVGLETRVPLGKPPVQINDHYTHVRPFLATSRILRSNPDMTFYTNFSYDRSVKLTSRQPPPPEVIRRHIAEVAPGLLYKPGELGYFGEYRFQHIQEPDSWHLAHETQIGTIWDVPLWRTARWHLPGKWQAELGYKFRTEEGHGNSQGLSLRVNWKTTVREVLTHMSAFTNSAQK
jgi:hypothetical protein